MTEEEVLEEVREELSVGTGPLKVPSQTPILLPLSILIGSILISASIIFGSHLVEKNLKSAVALSGMQTAAAPAQQQPGGAPTQPIGPVTVTDRSDEPVLGNKDAKVTIVEFGDFQCPFCKQFYQQSFNDIKTKYVDTGKVKYVFRHFPLTQIHVNAQISALAAECANRQGEFWQYHDLLYTNGQSDGTALDKASLEKYADQLGLNKGSLLFGKNKFNQCLESSATAAVVQADQAEGNKDADQAAGTKNAPVGTPTFYINGIQLVGAQPAAAFEQAIEAALQKS